MIIKGFGKWNVELRNWTSVVAILCVLLSACPVKAQIKNLWLDAHPIAKQDDKTPEKTGENKMLSATGNCVYETRIAKSSARTGQPEGGDQARLHYTLIVLLGLLESKAFLFRLKGHPRYRNSKKVPQSVPLFLKFQRLLLHF